MRGPFVLSKYGVDMVVPPRMLGVVALSNTRDSLEVIKRTDRSACEEIKSYFNQYKYFWVEFASCAKEAFQIECEIFHGQLAKKSNGRVHPKAPAESAWHCPVCQQ
jgi:hypothetical protein